MAHPPSSSPPHSSRWISQDYFDELCLENSEVFELSVEEAIKETVHQLEKAASNNAAAELRHVTQTWPSSEAGQRVRLERTAFLQALECLSSTETSSLDSIRAALDVVQARLDPLDNENSSKDTTPTMYAYLFAAQAGFSTYMSLWKRTSNESGIVQSILQTTVNLLERPDARDIPQLLSSFQDAMPTAMHAWLDCYQQQLHHQDDIQQQQDSTAVLRWLLQVAYLSCKRNEANKKAWMQLQSENQKDGTISLANLLVQTLQKIADDDDETSDIVLASAVSQLITVLSTFDDFRRTDDGITVQSTHTNVQKLSEAGAVLALYQTLQHVVHSTLIATDQSSAIVNALRSMAIQDDTVQKLVSVGVIFLTAQLLRESLQHASPSGTCDDVNKKNSSNESAIMATAVLGLYRNLAGNDEIKTTLCVGSDSIVPSLVRAMDGYPDYPLLQEHACGLAAAMALRKPKNAAELVAAQVHVAIVQAMQRHAPRVALQRQAALALRNLVSRSPQLRQAVLDAGAEQALREIAAKHVACQDEVYAALRDLGLSASMLHVEQDEITGKVNLQTQRQMFGERNPNFRPVYD